MKYKLIYKITLNTNQVQLMFVKFMVDGRVHLSYSCIGKVETVLYCPVQLRWTGQYRKCEQYGFSESRMLQFTCSLKQLIKSQVVYQS